ILAERFGNLSGLAVEEKNVAVLQSGHASFIQAVEKAREGFRAGDWQWCVIGAFDSMVEATTLQWLYDSERLKCEDNPVGLQPGEAGVAVLLEPERKSLGNRAAMQALIGGCATGEEKNHFHSDNPPTGRGLAQVVARLNEKDEPRGATPWVI